MDEHDHPKGTLPFLLIDPAILAQIPDTIAYGPTLVRPAITTPFTSPGFRVW